MGLCVAAWVDIRVEVCIGGLMDGWMDGWEVRWMRRCVDGKIGQQMNQ